ARGSAAEQATAPVIWRLQKYREPCHHENAVISSCIRRYILWLRIIQPPTTKFRKKSRKNPRFVRTAVSRYTGVGVPNAGKTKAGRLVPKLTLMMTVRTAQLKFRPSEFLLNQTGNLCR